MVETAPREALIGKSLPNTEGVNKVTGVARFGADIHHPGMLHGIVVRSPHAHARIRGIDTSRAEAVKGVHAVITGADFPQLKLGDTVKMGVLSLDIYRISKLAMARDKALFHGHPVAAVAAATPEIAAEAAALVEVDYEVLPHVIDEVESMSPGAPVLHEDLFTAGLDVKPDVASNVSLKLEMGRGDIAKGEAEADVVVERSFKTQTVHQGYIEPEAESAWLKADGTLTVWADTQGPFGQRAQLAKIVGLPEPAITVIPMEVGGGFGAKSACRVSPLAAILSKKSGRPVKIVLSREEVLRATGPGVAATNWVRVGAKRDGTITSIDARMIYNAGSFPGSPLAGGTLVGFSPYKTPNLRIIGYDVVTNRPKVQAYRAPGGPPITFAVESVIDELAEKLGIDKLEFREKNAPEEGDLGPNDLAFNSIGLKSVLERVKDHPAWTGPMSEARNGGKVGRGLALGFWRGGTNTSSCELSVNGSGLITVIIGSVDLSLSRTAFMQIVCDELQVSPEDVHVRTGDTDSVGYTDGTGGSRVTYVTGTAVYNACQSALAILKERAARKLDVTPDVIDYAGGVFSARDIEDRSVSMVELAADSVGGAGVISVTGTATGMAPAPAYAAHVAEVEVDPDTGKVDVLKFTAFQDVGKAIHRDGVIGQIQGGVAQGVGWGLHEAYVWGDDGALQNASLLDYRMPTMLDLPMIDVELIEVPASEGPYGVRGAGEVPIVPPPAALANAIKDAMGIRMDQLPMSPENVFKRLMEGDAGAEDRRHWLGGNEEEDSGQDGMVAGVDTPDDE
ncbi:MAG: xanthine dehydrogenase family protein molybdopterin-binding subunit [Chloroflexi bacterium]|nr:xanthine dehydrogenase family protein molybdopterin-binding subunit [Chloroflexota bacterium]